MNEVTPAMKQFFSTKEKYPDCVIFFRMGDFYEMFYEDAELVSKELGITLTSRGTKAKIPLAGIPYHALDSYLYKLVKKGYKVVICEQVEDPKTAKGVVKRDVVRVVTAGTIFDENILDKKNNNYLASIHRADTRYGLSLIDISTNEFLVTEVSDSYKLLTELARFKPVEIIASSELQSDTKFLELIHSTIDTKINVCTSFEYDRAYSYLIDHFKVHSLEGFGCQHLERATIAAAKALNYLKETQKSDLESINRISTFFQSDYMVLDLTTQKNLELISNIRDSSIDGTILDLLDKTKTPMGSRLLRRWLQTPLLNILEIKKRQDAVEEIFNNILLQQDLSKELNKIQDIERLLTKISYETANAKTLLALKISLKVIPTLIQVLSNIKTLNLQTIRRELDPTDEVVSIIEQAIVEDPPHSVREGNMIKEGYNHELDEIKYSISHAKEWIANLESKEKEKTGIKSLKVGFNKVFGYYIEVTHKNIDLVPDYYIRKQTTVNSERYITSELKEYESRVLNAQEEIAKMEYNVFKEICSKVLQKTQVIQKNAQLIAELDVYYSLATVAKENDYVKPNINENDSISIIEGRHPVVEKLVSHHFVPNDTELSAKENTIMIITGPNMSGKCVTPDTLVFSEQGTLPIEAFKPERISEGEFKEYGTTVVGMNSPAKTSHFYWDGFKSTIKITTRRGYKIEGTYNHSILVRTPEGEECFKRLEEINSEDYIIINRKNDLWGCETQINYDPPNYYQNTKKYPLPNELSEDLAYLLGLLIGDGTMTYNLSYVFSTADEFLKNEFIRIHQCLFNYKPELKMNKIDMSVTSRFLRDFLDFLGLKYHQGHEKEIPAKILKAPKNIVRAFLQGLFDTNGTAEKKYGNIVYTTTSKKLASQLHVLLLNFGILSSLKKKKTASRDSFDVRITGIDSITFYEKISFRLPRKNLRQNLASSLRMTNVDSIPYFKNILMTIKSRYLKNCDLIPKKYKLKYNKKISGIYYSYIRQKRNISFFKLKELIEYCVKCNIDCSELKEVYNKSYFYDKIKTIKNSESEVFDFTVPQGHAFVGNGIINHNSTYIRQVGLVAVLAQIGSFVPAKKADLCIVDRIFTRVGAHDDLTHGQSTFMVETQETANILNNATQKSLVILDEIGRGTSTFDGLSIAWAVTEYLHDIGAKTLFATHYHQLNELSSILNSVKNYRIAVSEEGENITFLHKIVPGGTDKSYGIHVAKLAGMPKKVINRSKEVLEKIGQEHVVDTKVLRRKKHFVQMALPVADPIVDKIRKIDIDTLTPIDALNILSTLKKEADSKNG